MKPPKALDRIADVVLALQAKAQDKAGEETRQTSQEGSEVTERIVCQFSCGAASAVATKLILAQYPREQIQIINSFLVEEHPDNRRFLADCQRWFDHPIIVLHEQKYHASAREVFRRKRFLTGVNFGPACSFHLKRELLDAYRKPTDTIVLGYTAEEQKRFDSFQDRYPQFNVVCPLIEKGLLKADCLAIIQRAEIELPMMYRLGYNNAKYVAHATQKIAECDRDLAKLGVASYE